MALTDNITARNKSITERRYINQVLKQQGEEILKDQSAKDREFNLSAQLGSSRSFKVNSNRLTYQHSILQRFLDMKKVRGELKPKSERTPIHNRIIMGRFNQIKRELRYGFTDAIRSQLAQQLKIEVDG